MFLVKTILNPSPLSVPPFGSPEMMLPSIVCVWCASPLKWHDTPFEDLFKLFQSAFLIFSVLCILSPILFHLTQHGLETSLQEVPCWFYPRVHHEHPTTHKIESSDNSRQNWIRIAETTMILLIEQSLWDSIRVIERQRGTIQAVLL